MNPTHKIPAPALAHSCFLLFLAALACKSDIESAEISAGVAETQVAAGSEAAERHTGSSPSGTPQGQQQVAPAGANVGAATATNRNGLAATPPAPPPKLLLAPKLARVPADIVGVTIGMTPAEVAAASEANQPGAKRKIEHAFSKPVTVMLDQIQNKLMDPMELESVQAIPNFKQLVSSISISPDVTVLFAGPPDENRVIHIQRRDSPRGTALEVYRDAVLAKYGKPRSETPTSGLVGSQLTWVYPADGRHCENPPNYHVAPEKPETCDTVLVVKIVGNPVSYVDSTLANVGDIALANARNKEFTDGLKRQLREKELSSAAAAPKL